MAHPKLRSVDAYPIEAEGETYFVLRDPEGVAADAVLLSPAAFFVACLLDGRRDTAGIREAFSEQFQGAQVRDEEIEQVVSSLDARSLLDSESYRTARRKMAEEFAASKSRKPFHAGGGYAATARELTEQLIGYYRSQEGAGEPAGPPRGGLRGVLAPHIDFHRGGTCYTHAYRRIAERSDADLYLILAVAHSSPPTPFVFTAKDFETPLGRVETDREFVEAVRRGAGSDLFEHELVHRTEHSAEFQTVFLKHAAGDRPIRAVPVLCSSFEPHCGRNSPSSTAVIEERIALLQELIRGLGRKVCIIGGVDFAHIGPRFGDRSPVTPQVIRWMEREDEESLDRIEEGDAEGFWESVMKDGNKRRVCGLTATYTALRLLSPCRGKLLKYGYAPDPAGGIVSFASVEFGDR